MRAMCLPYLFWCGRSNVGEAASLREECSKAARVETLRGTSDFSTSDAGYQSVELKDGRVESTEHYSKAFAMEETLIQLQQPYTALDLGTEKQFPISSAGARGVESPQERKLNGSRLTDMHTRKLNGADGEARVSKQRPYECMDIVIVTINGECGAAVCISA
ncbi:hypothetical protein NDU88_003989 [Pleurodeles waltl]|uniref:Uncharacterized protein n=1 Tax=Pleurodeles waltl TaxID=8319 RepID=A0AAV7T736_PLEWA|nr:hypothetical protein NDU88_003989 [Pleurodeles waltl]